ncbi:MAG: peptidoglycan-binding protein [Candidatus Dormibacteraeota bacterium]|nr:peptidoglycan-binding protein [Candidatus Dormibacteraeota bacterium]
MHKVAPRQRPVEHPENHAGRVPGVASILRLQRLVGNASVTDLVGTSLSVQRSAPVAEPPVAGTVADAHAALAPPPVTASASGPTVSQAPAPAQTPEDVAKSKPLLRLGSQGAAVNELQTRLNLAGAQPVLKVDGIFGPRTQRAVRKYQALSALSTDGIVGGKTWLGLGVYKETRSNTDTDRKAALDKVTIDTVGHGSSSAAIAAAKAIQQQEWLNLDLAGLKQLDGLTIELHVIPHDKKMTDLDEFTALKGQTTFDGRLWDDVRGINMGKDGTKVRSAVGEEALITIKGQPAGYGPGFVAAHETGHALKNALTAAQLTKLTKLFTDRVAAHATPAQGSADDANWLSPSWYTGANEDEYFADSIAAYLNHPYDTGEATVKMYTPGWLAANDSEMYTFLQGVF